MRRLAAALVCALPWMLAQAGVESLSSQDASSGLRAALLPTITMIFTTASLFRRNPLTVTEGACR